MHADQDNFLFLDTRESQGLKQKDVSQKAGITASALSLFESGKTTLSSDTLIRLAKALNMNPDYLLGNAENPFLSEGVIKFHLRHFIEDSWILQKIISIHNGLQFITIYPYLESFSRLSLPKMFSKMTPYAVAVKDPDGNMFIFSNKIPDRGLRQEAGADMQSRLTPFFERGNKDLEKMRFRNELTEEIFREKIDKGTITREDLDPYFAKFNNASAPEFTDEEIKLIRKLREHNIRPEDIEIPESSTPARKKHKTS